MEAQGRIVVLATNAWQVANRPVELLAYAQKAAETGERPDYEEEMEILLDSAELNLGLGAKEGLEAHGLQVHYHPFFDTHTHRGASDFDARTDGRVPEGHNDLSARQVVEDLLLSGRGDNRLDEPR